MYAAIALALAGADPFGWGGGWLLSEVLLKIAVGVVGGVVVGRGLGALFFRAPSERLQLASHAEGFVALAATLLAYGLTEVADGYGFLAVFVCALSIRASERDHEYQVLHDFVEQIERLLTVLLLVLFGGAVVRGLLGPLTWPMVAVGVALVLVVRPVTAWLALRGATGSPQERTAIAMFGIRGIGSFYYLAYATSQAPFEEAEQIWAAVGFVVVLSVTIHGIAVTPIMRRLDRGRRDAEVS